MFLFCFVLLVSWGKGGGESVVLIVKSVQYCVGKPVLLQIKWTEVNMKFFSISEEESPRGKKRKLEDGEGGDVE